MSIWMWSMKLRFQIGSNSPLANRKARMFCAASLPRKWSIRKTWLSRNAVHLVVQLDRALQVGAERLLHHHPGPLDQAGVLEHGDHRERGLRRHAQVVQSQHVVAEFGLGLGNRRGQRRPARRSAGRSAACAAKVAHWPSSSGRVLNSLTA